MELEEGDNRLSFCVECVGVGQILGRALGGKTGRAGSGWDIGFRTVHLSSSSNFFSTLKLPARLSIIECHRDEVRELPPKAEIIGWSEKTGIEMFKYGDHMMGIQGHPEYTTDILLHLIDRLLLKDLISVRLLSFIIHIIPPINRPSIIFILLLLL